MRSYWCAAISLVLAVSTVAQEPANETSSPGVPIRVTTKMVQVDVIVTDKSGSPIRDLSREDFVLEESGKPQTIAAASEQNWLPLPQDRPPDLPGQRQANVFTNRPTAANAGGPLVILLLDGLNTAFKDQAYARQELIRYVATQLQSGQRIAVFALTDRLIRLQDFTTDPSVLQAAIARYTPQQLSQTARSNSLNISTTANATFTTGSTDAMVLFQTRTSLGNGAKPSIESALASLQAFDSLRAAVGLEGRITTTLEAFRAIARSVGAYRGRKNLVWVSSAFPFSLVPDNGSLSPNLDRGADPTAPPPLPNQTERGVIEQDIQKRYTEEIRRVAAMMGDVQMAIYPVDARGLMPGNVNDAGDAGLTANGRILFGRDFSHQLSTRGAAAFSSQQNMTDLADQTGGRAFVNRNDIDNAVAIAAAEGSSSYTLAYYPSDKRWNGAFRKIKVRVRRPGLQVRHRTGYFAFDATQTKGALAANKSLTAVLQNPSLPATMVLFDVEVRPRQSGTVEITFLVDPKTVATALSESKQNLALDFFAVAYARDGRIVANTGKTVRVALTGNEYATMMQKGLMLPIDIKLAAGDYRLQLAVQDTLTGYVGSVDALATVP